MPVNVMLWRTKKPEPSKVSEQPGTKKVVSDCSASLRSLVVLPTDPISKSFETRIARFELEVDSLSDDVEYVGRASERLREAAEEFGTKQRDAIDKTLYALNNGVRGLAAALENCISAGESLENASNQSATRLATLHKAPNYEALCKGLQDEIKYLNSAIKEHHTKVSGLHEKHSEQLAELHSRVDQAQSVAKMDYLTSLGNRRSHDEALAAAILGVSQGDSYSFALIDLDGFKALNDTLGHTMGDRALVLFGQRLTSVFGKAASISRLGGDEFTVLTKGTQQHLLSRLVSLGEELERNPIEEADIVLPLGCSFGTIQVEKGMSAERVVALADHAMYAHKAERKASRRAMPRAA